MASTPPTSKSNLSFDSPVPEGKRAEDTKLLDTKAKDPFATGTNVLKRTVGKHKPFGELGNRGMP